MCARDKIRRTQTTAHFTFLVTGQPFTPDLLLRFFSLCFIFLFLLIHVN